METVQTVAQPSAESLIFGEELQPVFFLARGGTTVGDLADFLNLKLKRSTFVALSSRELAEGAYSIDGMPQLLRLLRVQGFDIKALDSVYYIIDAEGAFLPSDSIDNRTKRGTAFEVENARASLVPAFQLPATLVIVDEVAELDVDASSSLVLNSIDFLKDLKASTENLRLTGLLHSRRSVKSLVFPLSETLYTLDQTETRDREERAISDAGTSTVSGYSQISAGIKIKIRAEEVSEGAYVVFVSVEDSTFTNGNDKLESLTESRIYLRRGQTALIATYNESSEGAGLSIIGGDVANRRRVKKFYLIL